MFSDVENVSSSTFDVDGVDVGQVWVNNTSLFEVMLVSHGVLNQRWKQRYSKRSNPVLAARVDGDHVDVVGPVEDSVKRRVTVEQFARIGRQALTEPDVFVALQQVTKLLESDVDGVVNQGMLANYELEHGVPLRDDWTDACQMGTHLQGRAGAQLLERLGWDAAYDSGILLLSDDGSQTVAAVGVVLDTSEHFERPVSRFGDQTPVTFGLLQAERHRVPFLLAVREREIRLYRTATSGAVGQRGRTETYVATHLDGLDGREGYVPLLMSPDALKDGGTFHQIAEASLLFTSKLSSRLRERVYTQVVPRLAAAIAQQEGGTSKEALDSHMRAAVTVLFRLLFIAYAEDQKLLPYDTNENYKRHSLKQQALEVADLLNSGQDVGFDNPFTDIIEPSDAETSQFWDTCRNLFAIVDKGKSVYGVPAYNGGLFSKDGDVNPSGPTIERLRLTDAQFGPAFAALTLDVDDDGHVGPVDFRSLSVREFGTIYEGLLESELSVTDVNLTVKRDKKQGDLYVPAEEGDTVVAAAGDVYLHNKSGARKATGAYFTKPFAVEHLIGTAVLPTFETHLERVAALLPDEDAAADLLFDFRVADIAMGSGHFLTAVVDALEAQLTTFLADHPIGPVARMLDQLRQSAYQALGDHAATVTIDDSQLLRRMVARRCIYGVDINPVSVELARVAMWIHTFVPGLPLSFLNHNLAVGDSLTGIGTVEEAVGEIDSGDQISMSYEPILAGLEAAKEPLGRMAAILDVTSEDVKAARTAAAEADEALQPVRNLFDLLVAARLGRVSLPIVTSLQDLPDRDVVAARDALDGMNVVHFPTRFPEVFNRERPGFDVLIGNPPWDKTQFDDHYFWARHFPGYMGLSQTKKREAQEKYRSEHPELVALHESEKASIDVLKQSVKSGPYQLGSGNTDLAKVFAWRFWRLTRTGGRVGVILPRTLSLQAAGMEPWRREVLEDGTFDDVCVLANTGGWVFDDVHGQYTVALLTLLRNRSVDTLTLHGPYATEQAYRQRHETPAATVEKDVFSTWTNDVSFPLLPDKRAAQIYSKMMEHPRFGNHPDLKFRPVQEVNATTDSGLFTFTEERPEGFWPVYSGASFNLWTPETGNVYAWADPGWNVGHLAAKRRNQARTKSSAFYGLTETELDNQMTLPCLRPRICFRDITSRTNSRTMIAALIPPNVIVQNSAPHLFVHVGTEPQEAYLLGVFASHIFDWCARRTVELHMNFKVLSPLPVPSTEHPLVGRVIDIAGRLAAVDGRYAEWAAEVGVPVGSVTDENEKTNLIAELDALVAHLYGLDEDEVVHIFETFHRGWDYQPTLDRVLTHFRRNM